MIAIIKMVSQAGSGHSQGIPIEAELAAVVGHEKGPLPPYEGLFQLRSGLLSTDQNTQYWSLIVQQVFNWHGKH